MEVVFFDIVLWISVLKVTEDYKYSTSFFFQNIPFKILTLVLFMLNLATSKLGLVVTQHVIPSDSQDSCSGVNECSSMPSLCTPSNMPSTEAVLRDVA